MAVFPLVKGAKQEKIAKQIYSTLSKRFNVTYDKSGSVGRRYARNDEIGTPFCITVDEQSLKDKTVTIRDRDTTKQKRIKIGEVVGIVDDLVCGEKTFKDL